MRAQHGIAIAMLLVSAAFAAEPKFCDRQNFGFKGAVHTIRSHSIKLAPDPRQDSRLIAFPAQPWLEFDPAGNVIEEAASQDPEGNATGITRTERRGDGTVLRRVSEAPDGTQAEMRSEDRNLPDGRIERLNFLGGKLLNRTVESHDAAGRITGSSTFEADGKLVSKAVWKYDESGNVADWMVSGIDGLAIHMADRYEGENGLVRSGFDPAGRLVWTFAMRDGALTSWWRDPVCSSKNGQLPAWCQGSLGWSDSDKGITRSYGLDRFGNLQTTIEQHPGSAGNIDPDSAERYNADGTLLEKIAFEYVRDRQGNWVKRTVSAWDANSNSMVPISEDQREITYY